MSLAPEVGMNRLFFALLISIAACGPRQVEVRSAPSQPAQNAIQLTNGLSQAVNVYVNYNGNDQFIQQVRANSALMGLGTSSSVVSRARVLPDAGSGERNAIRGVDSHASIR